MKDAGDLGLAQRDGLPDALRVLAEAYPRAVWAQHANFGEMICFWMQRHAMFRDLTTLLQQDAEAVLSQRLDREVYDQRLAHYGGTLLTELHSHHHIEDSHYFPRLIELDARLERGFALLEADHAALDGLLQDMAEHANAVLAGGEVGAFKTRLSAFQKLLNRHLTDEEEIVVPVVLRTGFAG